MEKLIAACGIDCSECDARKATLANDNDLRAQVAEKWSKEYGADLTAEHINCMGCMEAGVHFSHCNECDYRACVRGRGLKNCAECEEYPCEMISQFHGYVPSAKANLEELR
ncbi:MAG: DUF3795 domain-containing protein [Candidatus Cloacimonetes bacterium]|nr:DUF3795 domain-containing protein [Candidatus Cloacimonadota bacterium]